MAKITDTQMSIILDFNKDVTDAAKDAGCSPSTVRKYRKLHLDNAVSEIIESQITPEQYARSMEIVADHDVALSLEPTDAHDELTLVNVSMLMKSTPPDPSLGKCGFAPPGSRFACGLPADHQHRRIGHCYGDAIEREASALATSSLD